MKKIEQKKLLTLTAITEMGWSFIGIFLVFFVQENFGLNAWQLILWFALLQIIFGLLVYPLNHWGLPKLGLKNLVSLGIALECGFVILLATGWSSWWSFAMISFAFLFYLCFYWPSYNYLNTVATKSAGRGSFLANVQTIYIGAGLITPILTGWLFDIGLPHLSLWLALSFYIASVTLSRYLHIPTNITPLTYRQSATHLRKVFFTEGRFWGFLNDLTGNAVMWIVWPLYFQFIVGKFLILGALTSLAALVEIFIARWVGKIADKKTAKSILQYSVWIRVIDLGARSSFLVYSSTWFVALIQSLGAVLGPFFLIPYSQRTMEVGEEQQGADQLFDYFVIREVFLGIGRGIVLLISSLLVYYFGIWIGGIIIALAGLTALGARKL